HGCYSRSVSFANPTNLVCLQYQRVCPQIQEPSFLIGLRIPPGLCHNRVVSLMPNPHILDEGQAARPDSTTTTETESFGDLLTQFEQSHSHRAEQGGHGIEGTVVAVSGESVFLDIGFKTEGIIPLIDFQNAGETIQRGDKVIVSIKGRD